MFDYCKMKDKVCPMATKSMYDPDHEDYLWKEHTFCGAMGGLDTRVKNLSECWLDMNNGKRRKHVKEVNIIAFRKRGYHYDEVRKRWVKV